MDKFFDQEIIFLKHDAFSEGTGPEVVLVPYHSSRLGGKRYRLIANFAKNGVWEGEHIFYKGIEKVEIDGRTEFI